MAYYEVNSSCGGLIACFVTEAEAISCANEHEHSAIVRKDGIMPKKPTIEDARRVMAELKEDTPENRRRQQLFDEWAATNPGWQSIKEQFGKGE